MKIKIDDEEIEENVNNKATWVEIAAFHVFHFFLLLSKTMDQDQVFDVLGLLRESETLGETVLRDRAEIVQLDRIRNKNREALTAMKREPDHSSVHLCIGNMFIKHRLPIARKLINEDQKNVNEEIERLRSKIKSNVQRLEEMEDKGEQFNVYNLNPLDPAEMRSFKVILNSIEKLQI